MDAYDHDCSYPHDLDCSCPYYYISDESYARLNAIKETMSERYEHFVSEMMEFGLMHETNSSLPIPRLKSSLYDDYESFLLLESNVVDDAPLTDLEEVFDPPLSSLPLVAPFFSSTPEPLALVTRPYLLIPSLKLSARGWRWVRFLRVMSVFWRMIHLVG